MKSFLVKSAVVCGLEIAGGVGAVKLTKGLAKNVGVKGICVNVLSLASFDVGVNVTSGFIRTVIPSKRYNAMMEELDEFLTDL